MNKIFSNKANIEISGVSEDFKKFGFRSLDHASFIALKHKKWMDKVITNKVHLSNVSNIQFQVLDKEECDTLLDVLNIENKGDLEKPLELNILEWSSIYNLLISMKEFRFVDIEQPIQRKVFYKLKDLVDIYESKIDSYIDNGLTSKFDKQLYSFFKKVEYEYPLRLSYLLIILTNLCIGLFVMLMTPINAIIACLFLLALVWYIWFKYKDYCNAYDGKYHLDLFTHDLIELSSRYKSII